VQANQQVYNPVATFGQDYPAQKKRHNNGVVVVLPMVPFPGASTATGEVIFGIDTSDTDLDAANNMRPTTATQVRLGTEPANSSYLNITTTYNETPVTNSYLDTGTNGLFFSDNSSPLVTVCEGSTWYCPFGSLLKKADLCDGDNSNPPLSPSPLCDASNPLRNTVRVFFTLDNAEAMFSTANTAFAGLAGAPPIAGSAFAWGLPFFYGRRVFLSMWRQTSPVSTPWYAWESL
jgi:hypothetical protein